MKLGSQYKDQNRPNFMPMHLLWINTYCLNSVLSVKVGTFNQEKALVTSRGLLCDCENLRLKL